MFIGIEFFAESVIGISQGNFFRTRILVNGTSEPLSHGEDHFNMDGVILKGYRVAASGRKTTHGLHSLAGGLGTLKIPQGEAFSVTPSDSVLVVVETDLFKDPNFFKEKLGIMVFSNSVSTPIIPLKSPVIPIKILTSKEIHLDITDLVKALKEKIS